MWFWSAVLMVMMMMMMMPVAVCCLLFTGGDDNDDGGFFKKMVHVETPISLANRFSQVGWLLQISIISNDGFQHSQGSLPIIPTVALGARSGRSFCTSWWVYQSPEWAQVYAMWSRHISKGENLRCTGALTYSWWLNQPNLKNISQIGPFL